MTLTTGLHGVTLPAMPGTDAKPRLHRPVLVKSPVMTACIAVLTGRYQPSVSIAQKMKVRPATSNSALSGLLKKRLAQKIVQPGSKYTLWRLTPLGVAERDWHARQEAKDACEN